jgi:hypothetical protein
MSYINKIEPYKEKERAAGFVVYPKQFLKEAPILQALNSSVPFAEPKRVHTIDWQYRIPQWIEGTSFENTGKYDEQPAQLFKLEIIR